MVTADTWIFDQQFPKENTYYQEFEGYIDRLRHGNNYLYPDQLRFSFYHYALRSPTGLTGYNEELLSEDVKWCSELLHNESMNTTEEWAQHSSNMFNFSMTPLEVVEYFEEHWIATDYIRNHLSQPDLWENFDRQDSDFEPASKLFLVIKNMKERYWTHKILTTALAEYFAEDPCAHLFTYANWTADGITTPTGCTDVLEFLWHWLDYFIHIDSSGWFTQVVPQDVCDVGGSECHHPNETEIHNQRYATTLSMISRMGLYAGFVTHIGFDIYPLFLGSDANDRLKFARQVIYNFQWYVSNQTTLAWYEKIGTQDEVLRYCTNIKEGGRARGLGLPKTECLIITNAVKNNANFSSVYFSHDTPDYDVLTYFVDNVYAYPGWGNDPLHYEDLLPSIDDGHVSMHRAD